MGEQVHTEFTLTVLANQNVLFLVYFIFDMRGSLQTQCLFYYVYLTTKYIALIVIRLSFCYHIHTHASVNTHTRTHLPERSDYETQVRI